MAQKRPVNLDLTTIRQPIAAIASILHRITGVVLFFGIPYILWLLQGALGSADAFGERIMFQQSMWGKLMLWATGSALAYHIIAGIRHLFMDIGVGESKEAGSTGAKAVLLLGVLVVVFWGIYVW
jgi:succinate dehydrogenase / fumarate reductase cytochrome b subunit